MTGNPLSARCQKVKWRDYGVNHLYQRIRQHEIPTAISRGNHCVHFGSSYARPNQILQEQIANAYSLRLTPCYLSSALQQGQYHNQHTTSQKTWPSFLSTCHNPAEPMSLLATYFNTIFYPEGRGECSSETSSDFKGLYFVTSQKTALFWGNSPQLVKWLRVPSHTITKGTLQLNIRVSIVAHKLLTGHLKKSFTYINDSYMFRVLTYLCIWQFYIYILVQT